MVGQKIITHLLALILITAALLILNYPILLNADFLTPLIIELDFPRFFLFFIILTLFDL